MWFYIYLDHQKWIFGMLKCNPNFVEYWWFGWRDLEEVQTWAKEKKSSHLGSLWAHLLLERLEQGVRCSLATRAVLECWRHHSLPTRVLLELGVIRPKPVSRFWWILRYPSSKTRKLRFYIYFTTCLVFVQLEDNRSWLKALNLATTTHYFDIVNSPHLPLIFFHLEFSHKILYYCVLVYFHIILFFFNKLVSELGWFFVITVMKYDIPFLDHNMRFSLWQVKMEAVLMRMNLDDILLEIDKMPST